MVGDNRRERIRLPNYLIGTDVGALKNDLVDDSEIGRIEAAEERIAQLEDYHRDISERVQENEKSFTSFSQQFMPGRTYVQTLLYKLVYDATITVPNGSQYYYPGQTTSLPTTGATVGFDISNDLQHAFYNLSAFTTEENRVVVYNGTIIVGADINVGIVRVYKPGPPRLESFLTVYNAGAECDLRVKVYRTIGIA